jgi:putative redox protein
MKTAEIETQDTLTADVTLINDKLHFLGKAGNNEQVHIDYIPPLGDNNGYMSLQLFLVSLASCAGSSVLTFLRRMKKNIQKCDIKASGVRRLEHPTAFESIILEFIIKSDDVLPADLDKVIALSEETYCPVWAMIKGNVPVKTIYTINKLN